MENSYPSPVFSFQSHEVRTIVENDQVWFPAVDVCRVLGISWNGATLKPIPESWKGLLNLNTPSGIQRVRVISEAGLYKLAFRSNKPQADAFTNWVASEVLPTIRKTGKYEAQPKALPKPKQRALPAAPAPSQVEALLAKVHFYIAEIAEAEKRIADITDDAMLQTFMPHPGREHPAWQFMINEGCAAQALWQSIHFSLKAVEESLKLRIRKNA